MPMEVMLMYSYSNLKAEMRRLKISQQDIASLLEINDIVAGQKINAQISFTLIEAKIVQSELFSALPIAYLFQVENIPSSQQGRLESR